MKWRHEPKRELMEEADEDMEQEIARSREEGGRRRSLAVHTPKSGRVCVCEMQSKCKAKAGRGRAGDGAGDWSRRLEQEKIRSREEGVRRRMACTRTPKSGRVCVCEMHVGRACSRHKYVPHTSVLVRTDPKPRARRPESARGHIV